MKENTALNEEAEKQYETLQADIDTAKNSIVNLSAAIGSILAPVVSAILNTFTFT